MRQSSADPRRRPIGVFDSGVGGLTVLHELLVGLANEDFLYLGDTARFPYGDRASEELECFSLQIAELLLRRGCKLLVIACNSATAAALGPVRARMAELAPDVAVIGVVEPESRLAVRITRTGRLGLLATPTTVNSGAYDRAVARAAPGAELFSVACPDLAPIIQGGFPFDQRVVDTVRSYCQPLLEARVDTVILGCTHYPLVAPILQRSLGRGITLVSAGAAAAAEVERELQRTGRGSPDRGEGEYRFLCTGDAEAFRALGTRFLQMPLGDVAHVGLGSTVAA